MISNSFPAIDAAIQIRNGTDLADVWQRFEVFEALHHNMSICNPMSSAELDEVIDTLAVSAGTTVLDVACGYGELLMRCAERAKISGVGVDLSPWMVTTALAKARCRLPEADLRWVLGEARDYAPDVVPDIAVCVGAEWVWHDFSGTTRALSNLLPAGGLAVVGAARLHLDADPVAVAQERGAIETIDDMARTLRRFELEPVHRVDPDDDGWDAYLQRTALAAGEWQRDRPGERAQQWVGEQADWQAARERDRQVIGWSVWIARKNRARA